MVDLNHSMEMISNPNRALFICPKISSKEKRDILTSHKSSASWHIPNNADVGQPTQGNLTLHGRK